MDEMRFRVLLYDYLFLEEQKHNEAVQRASEILRYNPRDTYSIFKYFIAVINLDEFNKLQRQIYDLLKR